MPMTNQQPSNLKRYRVGGTDMRVGKKGVSIAREKLDYLRAGWAGARRCAARKNPLTSQEPSGPWRQGGWNMIKITIVFQAEAGLPVARGMAYAQLHGRGHALAFRPHDLTCYAFEALPL